MKYISGFIKGFRRVFDAGGWLKSHRTFDGGVQKDYDALCGDWNRIKLDVQYRPEKRV
jgi:hypothetical protein